MMTNEEIKKGLELCKANWCVMCPYSNCIGCEGFLKQDALTLITKQEQEIQRLNSHNGFLQSVISHNKDMLDEAVKQAKIDVLNEVKERAVGLAAIETYHICNLIDELLKENE